MFDESLNAIEVAIAIVIPIVCFLFGNFLKSYHLYWIPESVGTMLVGSIFGFAVYFAAGRTISLPPWFFIYVLLPAIIFESGYSLKKRGMFRNLGTILMFAVFGTCFSVFAVGFSLWGLARAGVISSINTDSPLEALIFASLISATDTVATLSIMGEVFDIRHRPRVPLVYNLIFGESALNDAVAIVLYRTLVQMHERSSTQSLDSLDVLIGFGEFFAIAAGSILIGVFCGAVSALLAKHTSFRETYGYEVLSMYLLGGISYCLAEIAHCSGILTVFFSGLFMSHYTWYNISPYAQMTTRTIFRLFAFFAETIIFISLGFSPFLLLADGSFEFRLIFITSALLIVARIIQTAVLSALANIGRKHKITPKSQVLIMLAGLRGALSFSLAMDTLSIKGLHGSAIVATTLIFVVFSNVVFGGLTAPLLQLMNYMSEIQLDEYVPLLEGKEAWDINGTEVGDKASLAKMMSTFDRVYLKPFLTDPTYAEESVQRKAKLESPHGFM